jgi:prolipoprotein diacylglyceryltransferase
VTKKRLDIRVKTGDTFALPLALAVGRWGCFFNGCCYGVETTLPWGVSFRQKDGAWLRCHPTQIYESLFHFAMACVLLKVMCQGALKRQRLKLYLICYGVYRFLTELIRPEEVWLLGLTAYQWGALGLVIGLGLQWRADWQGLREPGSVSAGRDQIPAVTRLGSPRPRRSWPEREASRGPIRASATLPLSPADP